MKNFSLTLITGALMACGASPKTPAQITAALAKAPTGVVDAASAKQILSDNILRDGLATAMGTAEQRIPYGYATLSENACLNIPKDSGQTKELDLSTSGDGVSTGHITSVLKCSASGTFSFNFTISKACVSSECFEGNWTLEATDTTVNWSLRGYRTSGNSTVKRLVDVGGVNTVSGDNKFTAAQQVAYISEKEPQPTVILTWGEGGPNKYTAFALTGSNGKFLCASTDGGKTGDCSSVDAQGKPTNTGDFAF